MSLLDILYKIGILIKIPYNGKINLTMKNQKILAIIPARSGSKGLKNKNILRLNKNHWIKFTIDQAKKSKFINKD